MIGQTGIWDQETANTGHMFCYHLAKWIGEYLPKNVHVTDLGCGKGTYLDYLNTIGFESLQGFEGSYLNNIDFDIIKIHDLSTPMNIQSPWRGNVICLEVIEHIPSDFEDIVFDNICNNTANGCKVILSCAIPGQGGDGHVNCQNNLWVIKKMTDRGFKLLIDDSISARNSICEERFNYFKETILIFERV